MILPKEQSRERNLHYYFLLKINANHSYLFDDLVLVDWLQLSGDPDQTDLHSAYVPAKACISSLSSITRDDLSI